MFLARRLSQLGVIGALSLFSQSAGAQRNAGGNTTAASPHERPEALREAGARTVADEGLPPGHPDPLGGEITAGPLPPGEPDEEDDDALPPGHPNVPEGNAEPVKQANPPIFSPPPDTEVDAPDIPGGAIVVELRDAEGQPLPRAELTIGILHQSVAKGESRERKGAMTDDRGLARVEGLETGSGVAYRVTVVRDGATFAALPFQLPAQYGKHVTLHVYDVSHSLLDTLVVLQGIIFAEVKDDRVQIEQVFTVFNLGKVSWVPEDVILRLPPTFTALSAQQGMNDQGVDSVDKVGGRLHGTFSPGKHEVQFRWQLPYSGEKDIDFEVGLPPHVAFLRVMAGGSRGVKLSVAGFPDAQSKTDAQGGRVLVTEKQARRDEPLDSIHERIEGLPTPGPGRLVATALAGLGILIGLTLGWGSNPRREAGAKGIRSRLLSELFALEEARKTGDVGHLTYDKARRELIDALALTLDQDEAERSRRLA
jgi:hypothetical protein